MLNWTGCVRVHKIEILKVKTCEIINIKTGFKGTIVRCLPINYWAVHWTYMYVVCWASLQNKTCYMPLKQLWQSLSPFHRVPIKSIFADKNWCQRKDEKYSSRVEKHHESGSVGPFHQGSAILLPTSFDSNTHSLVPSGFTLFHQRSPTSNLPVTFFTVQKSKASSKMTAMNSSMKCPEKK